MKINMKKQHLIGLLALSLLAPLATSCDDDKDECLTGIISMSDEKSDSAWVLITDAPSQDERRAGKGDRIRYEKTDLPAVYGDGDEVSFRVLRQKQLVEEGFTFWEYRLFSGKIARCE